MASTLRCKDWERRCLRMLTYAEETNAWSKTAGGGPSAVNGLCELRATAPRYCLRYAVGPTPHLVVDQQRQLGLFSA